MILQAEAISRVKLMEKELMQISELRMKEESASDLSVGLFDTKRNISVTKGREALEREKKEREKSEVDLELDFLAPFLVKYDMSQMNRQKALQVRDECLESIKAEWLTGLHLINLWFQGKMKLTIFDNWEDMGKGYLLFSLRVNNLHLPFLRTTFLDRRVQTKALK